MAELLQEYELSIWDDINDASTGELGSFKEKKIAVIGGNKLHTPTKAYNVTLKENVNGEKTLTFSLPRAYRDKNGELKNNPFLSFLTAERKLKLREGAEYSFFDENGVFDPNLLSEEDSEEKWTDYIIKTVDEVKETFVNNYTCKEVYVNELGKNGWSVILDSELENNYGTLNELAEVVLKDSGWTVHKDSEDPIEKVTEPMFYGLLSGEIMGQTVVGLQNAKLSNYVYIFYSQLVFDEENNKWKIADNLDRVQVLWNNGNLFTNAFLDDNRQIVDDYNKYNYFISVSDLAGMDITWLATGSKVGEGSAVQGGRIVESIQSHFEPVADKYVQEYCIKPEHFRAVGLPAEITNSYAAGEEPSDYVVYYYSETEYLTSAMVQNYVVNASAYTALTGWNPSDEISINTWAANGGLPTAENWDTATNYVVLPNGVTVYNSGLEANGLFLEPAKELYLRVKAKMLSNGDGSTNSSATGNLTVGLGYKDGNTIKPISDTVMLNDWDDSGYYVTQLVVNDNIEETYGKDIVLYFIGETTNDLYPWHLEDAQLFDYVYNDEAGRAVYPEDIPEAKAIFHDHFYTIHMEEGREVTLPLIANKEYYTPNYRAGYAAVRHIDIKESNYFNNINSLAELFGVWAKFKVKHRKDGQLYYQNGKPVKEVKFTKFASEEDEMNWCGFRYGVNLKSIKRNVESTAVASKVIVKNNNNEFAPDGMGSITRAVDNPTGENVIFNFDYYVAHQLLDQPTLVNDLYGTTSSHFGYYYKLKELNQKIAPMNQKLVNMQIALENARQMLDFTETQIDANDEQLEDAIQEYEWRLSVYQEGDSNLTSQATAVASLKAVRTTLEKDLETYTAQISEYEKKINGQEWTAGEYQIGDVVKYVTAKGNVNSETSNWYKCIANTSIDSKPPALNSTNWAPIIMGAPEDAAIIDKLPVSAQADYWAAQKKRINGQFYQKYSRYIQEATWTDEKYMDDNLYYYDAIKVSNQNAWPKTKYTIGVIDISGVDKLAAYKFKIGQKSYVEDTEFFGYEEISLDGGLSTIKTPKKKEVIISERTRNFDDPSKSTITIKTYKNQFEELFSKMTATTQSLQYASGEYQRAARTVESDGSISIESLEQAFAKNSFILANAANQLVTWDSGRGIEVADAKNPLEVVRIVSSGIIMTNDGGRTWSLGVTAKGINTSLLTAGVITADKIRITSSASSAAAFAWTERGINAFKENGSGDSFVRFDQYGIYGTNRGLDLENAIQEATTFNEKIQAVQENSTFSITWDGLLLNYQEGSTALSQIGGLEVFNNGDNWEFTQEYIDNYAPWKPDGKEGYSAGERIPVVSVGRYYTSPSESGIQSGAEDEDISAPVAGYGLRLRNKEGFITLDTSGDKGDLWLRGSLALGYNEFGDAIAGISGYREEVSDKAIWVSDIFSVAHDGTLVAQAGSFTGSITATSGFIQGELLFGNTDLTTSLACKVDGIEYAATNDPEIKNTISTARAGINAKLNGATATMNDEGKLVFDEKSYQVDYVLFAGPYLEDSSTNPESLTANYTKLNARFLVDYNGKLTARDAEIHGTIFAENGEFRGDVYAENGSFTGTINATDGYIEKLYFGPSGDQSTTSFIGGKDGNVIINANNNFKVYYDGSVEANVMKLANDKIIIGNRNIFETDNFIIDEDGNVSMNGTLTGGLITGSDIRLTGTLSVGNNNDDDNENNKDKSGVTISGSDSGSIFGRNYHGTTMWSINGDGSAFFENIDIRGKISAAVFEHNTVSAVGGTLLVAPTLYVVEDITPEFIDGVGYQYIIKNVDGGEVWRKIGRIQVTVPNQSNSTTSEVKIAYNDKDRDVIITSETPLATDGVVSIPLIAGTQIMCVDKTISSVEITSQAKSGPQIIMHHSTGSGNDIQTKRVVIGNLRDMTDLPAEFSGIDDMGYGLYADNAYLTGHIYLPEAGLTNDSLSFSWAEWTGQSEQEDLISPIRFWAGASQANRKKAPLIITQDGSIYASKGVFRGQVIAKNSSFEGEISSAGIVLSHEDKTDIDYEHNSFIVKWKDDPNASSATENCPCEFSIAKFDWNGLELNQGFSYRPLERNTDTSREYPILKMIKNEADYHLVMNQLQVWDTSGDTIERRYSAILSDDKLVFKKLNTASTDNSFDTTANAIRANGGSLLSIAAKDDGGIIEARTLTIKDKVEFDEEKTKLYGALQFRETMSVECVADGIVYTFVGEEEEEVTNG